MMPRPQGRGIIFVTDCYVESRRLRFVTNGRRRKQMVYKGALAWVSADRRKALFVANR